MDYQHLEVNGYSSFNGLAGSMRHVKYDMGCAVARCRRSFSISWHACRCRRHSFLMAMSRFASMDQFGQSKCADHFIIDQQAWNSSQGGFIPMALAWKGGRRGRHSRPGWCGK